MSNVAAVARELGFAAAQALYLFAPLLVSAAIMALVIHFDVWPWLFRPIDGGWRIGDKRLFGDHKTWRGVVVVVGGSIATVAIQKTVSIGSLARLSAVDYDAVDAVSFGGAMGVGAALGELPNSFVKRRLSIPPGKSAHGKVQRAVFYIWDQVDLLMGAWPLIAPVVKPTPLLVAASFAVALIVHPLVAAAGYLLGVRPSPR